jgi:hypothetical protein
MSWRRIYAILDKDVRDALRDGRVALLLLMPIAFAVAFNAISPEEGELPKVSVAVVDPQDVGLASALKEASKRTAELEIVRADGEREAKRRIADDDADLAVIGRGSEGDGPARATVLLPDGSSTNTESVVPVVADAVTAAAGRAPPSEVRVDEYRVDPATQKPVDVLEQRQVSIGILIAVLAGMVALVVVPIQTAEEFETGTFGALRLAASGPEIFTAKALAGMLYGALSLVLTVRLTDLGPDDHLAFYAAGLGLIASLVAFGVLLGLLSRNATAINTYGTLLLFPIIGAAVAVLFVDDGPLKVVLDVLPFSQATRLLFDAMSPDRPFDAGIGAWAVIAAWGVAGYLLLARISSRREV